MLWRCTECTCAYAVGLPRCPHCTGTEHEEEDDVPKAHKDRPPTDATVIVPVELADEAPPPAAPVAEPTPEPAERPTPRPRHARAQAGTARGSGASS